MRSSRTTWKRARIPIAIGALGWALGACVTAPLESPQPTTTSVITMPAPQNLKEKVDLLFMIDNSGSMSAMQNELKDRFPQFFKPFEDLAAAGKKADLHIGVVTSDYGAGAGGAEPCAHSPGGEGGRLQAIGRKAAANCKKPTGDMNFVHYVFGGDPNDPANASNLPTGQNLIDTFTCMASVGDSGCGFEHQLESVYAALHNGLPENAGFLRDDAILAVVFLTNEDDASAPPDTDVFDKNRVAQYGFQDSYSRQTRFAIMCCPPGRNDCSQSEMQFPPYADSGGPLADCHAAPNYPTGAGPGKQYDITRYIDFFTKPSPQGGVKASPLDVVLIGIDAPSEPFQVILSNPGTPNNQPYIQCPQLNERESCVPVLQRSCVNQVHPELSGDPAVRLNTVINAARNHQVSSICADSYAPALDAAAKNIVSVLAGGCIPHKLPPDPAHPGKLRIECTVDDMTDNPDGTVSTHSIPQCPDNGANPGSDPCWRIEPKDTCSGLSPDGVGLTVDRAGQQPPDHTTAQIACVVQS